MESKSKDAGLILIAENEKEERDLPIRAALAALKDFAREHAVGFDVTIQGPEYKNGINSDKKIQAEYSVNPGNPSRFLVIIDISDAAKPAIRLVETSIENGTPIIAACIDREMPGGDAGTKIAAVLLAAGIDRFKCLTAAEDTLYELESHPLYKKAIIKPDLGRPEEIVSRELTVFFKRAIEKSLSGMIEPQRPARDLSDLLVLDGK